MGTESPEGRLVTPYLLCYFRQSNEQMIKSSNASSTSVSSTPLSPVKTTFSGQTCVSSIKPGPLPSNLDDLKVSEHFVSTGAEFYSLYVRCYSYLCIVSATMQVVLTGTECMLQTSMHHHTASKPRCTAQWSRNWSGW